MDLTYTKEHLELREQALDFAKRIIEPGLRERDEQAHPDPEIYRKIGQEGYLGACIPVKYGGLGLDYHSIAIISEAFEYIDTSARVIISVHNGLHSLALLQWGTEAQKQRLLAPVARGEKLATFCLTEPACGSDVAGLQAFAEKKGDRYILNGEKIWISLSTVADQYLVMAYTDRDKQAKREHDGITAFIVDRAWKGVNPYVLKGKLGVRAGVTGGVAFQNVEIPAENVLGNPDEGFKVAMSALDNGRYTVAAGCVGLMKACLDASTKYCHERTAFKREIGKLQLVQQMLAFMTQSIDTGDLLVRKVGWMKNQGLRNTRETSMAKWTTTVNAAQCADHAVEIHGAYGYSNEFPVERFWRNARGAVIYEGTKEIHQVVQAEYALEYRDDQPLRCELPKYEKA